MADTKKQTPQTRLSHQQKMRRNPIGWIIIIGLCAVFLGIKVMPAFFEWQTKSELIKKHEIEIPELESKNEVLQTKLTKIEQEFNFVADEYRRKEIQIFPSKINPGKIAKTFELFALQMENLDTLWKDSHFEITKISIAKSVPEKGKRYLKTPCSMNLTSDKKNIYEFVNFLQTQELPEEFSVGVTDGRVEPTVFQFLKDNLLPMMHIESIKISPEKEKQDRFAVQLEIVFFSNIK